MTQAVYVIEMVESERGWGQRPDGFLAFKSEEEMKAYITEETKDRTGPVPDVYVIYHQVGVRACSPEFYAKFDSSKTGRIYFDKLRELK